ncbi:GIY-YIG nuclease family protein [Apirhabdus apintestini]|uniref:GIY-YIG nuclease family protein n=1 Tax=Erwinia sp. HR93 TaxID=3094840 RepID=UPI002ADEEDB0|nr:GIY-YIG nuclease family protein [Erwinia sp. HR93]MEA1063398.1 GIY-YIG nuclease family protein [Erwinia sp. HR93]WPM85209.1 GIY-YIG nuclease family protein [Enterobacteriaceae bacterium CA-0114]
MSNWSLYILHTAGNRLYTGITTDVARRLREHQTGKGAKALRGQGMLRLVFSHPIGDRALALRVEYRIKQLTRVQKERLIADEKYFSAVLAAVKSG